MTAETTVYGIKRLRVRRLARAIADTKSELEHRIAVAGAHGKVSFDQATDLLSKADDAVAGGHYQEAWTRLHRARRHIHESYDPKKADDAAELAARARVLRSEAAEKLRNWRKEAVEQILPDDRGNPPLTSGALVLAQFLLDEHFENVYFKLELLRTRFLTVGYILASLVVLLFLSAAVLPRADTELGSIFFSLRDLSLVMLIGATGAGLSILLSLTKVGGRIPEVLQGFLETLFRFLVGALGAVAIVALIQAELLPIDVRTEGAIWVYALLAGFSDQFVVRALAAAEKAATG